jgi:hypothetical protein
MTKKPMIYNEDNYDLEATASNGCLNDAIARVGNQLGVSTRVGVTKFLNEYPRYVGIKLMSHEPATIQ